MARSPTLVSPGGLDPLTRLVLANAVYFKAAWSNPFETFYTSPEPFFLTSESGGADTVEVRMMRQDLDLRYWADEALGVEAVSIPYEAMSMVVLLPTHGSVGGVGGRAGRRIPRSRRCRMGAHPRRSQASSLRGALRVTAHRGAAGIGHRGGLRYESVRLLRRDRSSRGAEHLQRHARRLGEGG